MGRTTWFRRIATYAVTAIMAGFGLTGIASAQTITDTGPGSTNRITTRVTNNCSVQNNNNVSARNGNSQSATSGSANESDNTNAGVSWAGWSGFDPAAAQAGGVSYNAWWSGVANWVAQHASGSGWNSSQANLSWMPGGADWSGFDPMTWQVNGQSFGNWFNAVESYLNSNNAVWVLSWPADATGAGNFGGAVSGNATNSNSANFSININNAARAAAGTDSCGHSNFTPPPASGGMGGGGGSFVSAPRVNSFAPRGGSGGGSAVYYAPVYHHPASAPAVASAPAAPAPVVAPPAGGSGGGTPAAPVNSISDTGPGSTNVISHSVTDNSQVQNNNNVSVANMNSQSASTGSSNVSGNTNAGGGGSGDAANGTGVGVGVNN